MSRGTIQLLLVLGSTGCFHDVSEALPTSPRSDGGAIEGDGGAIKGMARDDAGSDVDASRPSDVSVEDGGLTSCPDGQCCDEAPGTCDPCGGACLPPVPVCDEQTKACRGCERDAECGATAVCVEADGVCVPDDGVAFVTTWGNDTGACTREAPCATISYALAQAGERKVIHVLGGSLMGFGPVTVEDAKGLVLDGEDTTWTAATPEILTIQRTAELTIEGFRFNASLTPDTAAVTVSEGAKARFYDVRFGGAGGLALWSSWDTEVTMRAVHVGDLTSNVATEIRGGGKLTVQQSILETSVVIGNGGSLTVSQNRFESAQDGSVRVFEGVLVMENNLVIHRDGYNDSISAYNMYPGSTIRFNTFINTTALPSDGAALSCDGTVVATSNVFAYNSGHPITGAGCETRYSVFDEMAQTSAGTGNRIAELDTLFVDRMDADYRLAPQSVARGAAEPGLDMVPLDLNGTPRPMPAGSRFDAGAFETK